MRVIYTICIYLYSDNLLIDSQILNKPFLKSKKFYENCTKCIDDGLSNEHYINRTAYESLMINRTSHLFISVRRANVLIENTIRSQWVCHIAQQKRYIYLILFLILIWTHNVIEYNNKKNIRIYILWLWSGMVHNLCIYVFMHKYFQFKTYNDLSCIAR